MNSSDDNLPLPLILLQKRKVFKSKESSENEESKRTKIDKDISMNGKNTGYEKRLQKMIEDVKNDRPVHNDKKWVYLVLLQMWFVIT